MLTRIISGVVAVAIFVAVVYFLPPIFFSIAVAVICAVAAYELTWRSGIVKVPAMSFAAVAFAATAPFFVSVGYLEKYAFALIFACFAAMFIIWLFNYGKASLVMTLASFFAAVIIPVMFSMILKIRAGENGNFLILLPFLAAWMTDTGAYFTGVFFGKHKLCPRISPKKTVEGSIGGIVVCIISLVVYAVLLNLEVDLVLFASGVLVLSVLAQAGDLSFSIIKREYNIKDYGNLMPGHGGVLDRFDSTMFTIPASYILLSVMGIVV